MRSLFVKNLCSQSIKQKAQISLRMQQSLSVLQMPIEELSAWLEERVSLNPLLEWGEERRFAYTEVEIPYLPSCFEHLMNQARLTFSSKLHLDIAEWIIGNLNKEGFYTLLEEELPQKYPFKEFLFCLKKIHEFDPIGMGAKSMQETLLLQLKAEKKENTLGYQLIQDHIEDLVEGRFASIEKKLGKNKQAIQKIIKEELSSLDPFPGYRFQEKAPPLISVDISLVEKEDGLTVHVQTPSSPIESAVPSLENLTKEETLLIKGYKSDVKWILNTLDRRNSTLKKITEHLVLKQKDYLEGTSNTLNPLSIGEVSLALDLHESTITRAVSHKNLFCPLGVIPLKNLFSKSLPNAVSYDKALKLLQKLIAEEDKKNPLSDRELLEKMRDKGILCARRTITKYRKALSIPAKYKRKKP